MVLFDNLILEETKLMTETKKEIYLDHAATTPALPEVAQLVAEVMTKGYGNPSSLHHKGVEAENYLRDAKETFAGILKAEEKELLFTSGGTESNNMALFCGAHAGRNFGKKVLISCIEHPSVAEPAKELTRLGYEVTEIPVDENGIVRLDALSNLLDEETILVSVMLVNNEVGSIQPAAKISSLIREKAPHALFHVDGVQAFGKMEILPKRMGIDLLSVSGHKLHGPKGVGLLYISSGCKIKPFVFGGGQQAGMRSGTENVPGIAGFARAAELACANLSAERENMYALKDAFVARLLALPDVVVNGPSAEGSERSDSPYMLNASFIGVRSEVLLHSLEDKGIYVSAGSACSSHKRAPSKVLSSMGCKKEQMDSALRFSFSRMTTQEELEETAQAIEELLPALRRFVRR